MTDREDLEALPDIEAYFARHPGERAVRDTLQPHLAKGSRLLHRDCHPGHLTGSAWIVDATREHALLLYHRKLARWLQPGGHADGDPDLARVALREAIEETGLASLRLASPQIFDFDIHAIPERGDVPAHYHLDARYLVVADRGEAIVESAESAGARWLPLDEVRTLCGDDASITRMIDKTRALAR